MRQARRCGRGEADEMRRRRGCGGRAKRKRGLLTRTRQHLATNNAINEVQRLRTESSPGEHPPLMRSIPSPKRARALFQPPERNQIPSASVLSQPPERDANSNKETPTKKSQQASKIHGLSVSRDTTPFFAQALSAKRRLFRKVG